MSKDTNNNTATTENTKTYTAELSKEINKTRSFKETSTDDRNYSGFRTVIVIPNYNGLRFLDDCMKAIDSQTVSQFVTLVIDNGSGEEDTKWLKSWQEKDKVHRELILNEKNLGFSGAVNQGIRFAIEHGLEFTLLLNNDTKIAPDFVEVLENRMDKDKAKKVFAVSSKMVKMHDPSIMDDAGDQMTVLGWQFQRGLDEPSSLHRWNTESEVFSACAGAAIYRTEHFKTVGLFDENHFAYLEDIDLCYRAQLYGLRVLYCPRALVHHVGSGTSGSKYNDFKVRISARNSLYLLYKNLPLFMVILNLFPILAGYMIKLLFFTAKGFGKAYMEGIFEAFSKFKTLKRAKINEVPPMRYLTLELRLTAATFEYASRLMKRYSPKARD